jgi:hypothetical protein
MFSLLLREQLNRFGKTITPAVAAVADFKNILREKFFILCCFY